MTVKYFILKNIRKIVTRILKTNPNKELICETRLNLFENYINNNGFIESIKEIFRAYSNISPPKYFETELAITAILKNEAPYIKEWIEFHKLVGVQKFFLYDNESNDNIKEILQPYIEAKEVIYTYLPGEKQQFIAYQDSIRKNANKVKYMAFIDIDEFITPVKYDTITEFLKYAESKEKHIGAIGINWVMHGFNGHKTTPEGLVCENFSRCDFDTDRNKHIKSIVNPRTVIFANHPHYFVHKLGVKIINSCGEETYDPFSEQDYEHIIINHFWTKSYEEYLKRCKKGKADGAEPIKIAYSPDFLSKDENKSMERFIPLLKEKISF